MAMNNRLIVGTNSVTGCARTAAGAAVRYA